MNTLIIFGAKYLFLLSPILVLFFFFKLSFEMRKRVAIFALISVPLALILFALARMIWFNPRPFMLSGVAPLIPHDPGNGFPSGHTLFTAILATLVTYFNRKTAAVLWIITLVVGVSRVYAGVHHLVDIGGSILIALLSGAYAYAIIHKPWKNKHRANF